MEINYDVKGGVARLTRKCEFSSLLNATELSIPIWLGRRELLHTLAVRIRNVEEKGFMKFAGH